MITDHDKLRYKIKNFRERCYEHPLNPGDLADLCCVLAAAESTLPKTKYDDVWHVEYVFLHGGPGSRPEYRLVVKASKLDADANAEILREPFNDPYYACVRVTGPHRHEVPA